MVLFNFNHGLLCKTKPTKSQNAAQKQSQKPYVYSCRLIKISSSAYVKNSANGETAADWRLLAINQIPSFPLFSYLNKLWRGAKNRNVVGQENKNLNQINRRASSQIFRRLENSFLVDFERIRV